MSRQPTSPPPQDAKGAKGPKQKRLRSRTDEEIISEMDKRGLPYRFGWPTLPPLPLEHIRGGTRFLIHNWLEHLEAVQSIINAQGISHPYQEFVFRIPRNAENTNDLNYTWRYLTLLFTADTTKDSQKIVDTIVKIRNRFRLDESTRYVNIECVDYRRMGGLLSYPICHHEVKTRSVWEEVAAIALQILSEHEWISLQLLRRGIFEDAEKCPPTIVITSPTADKSKWYMEILPQILKNMERVAPEFKVEVLCGVELWPSKKSYPCPGLEDETVYKEKITMGSSVGVEGDETGCGTLGASVVLEGDMRCGITSWHVVRDDRLDEIAAKSTDGALPPEESTLAASPQVIVSPSTKDHGIFLKYLQSMLSSSYDAMVQGDEREQVYFDKIEERIRNVENTSRAMGVLLAGSGLRSNLAPKHATGEEPEENISSFLFPLDWALIQNSNETLRKVVNRLPARFPPRLKFIPKLREGQTCPKWTTFNVESHTVEVAKHGRTSGFTFGEINSCVAYINPSACPGKSKTYGFSTTNPGRCYTVTNKERYRPFTEKGDEGSILIHDGSGAQLGLLIGTTGSGQGMMIPLSLVFQDIEDVTGKKVIRPRYVDPAAAGLE